MFVEMEVGYVGGGGGGWFQERDLPSIMQFP